MSKRFLVCSSIFLILFHSLFLAGLVSGSEENLGLIRIKSDGSIEPSNAPIAKNGATYILTDNLDATSIVVEKDQIVLDGNGYKIEGDGKDYSIGVDLSHRTNIILRKLIIENFYYGVSLEDSTDNLILKNTISDCTYIINSQNGQDNVVYQNNFINTINRVYQGVNFWNKGYPEGGNYWSDIELNDQFSGPQQDLENSDGIVDSIYDIDEDNFDDFPLMAPISFFNIEYDGTTQEIPVISNSIISSFLYDQTSNSINFNATNTEGSTGFCRICIPKSLISEPITVKVNNVEPVNVNYDVYDNETHNWILFTYTHPGKVTIIPEINQLFLMIIIAFIPATILTLRLKLIRDEKTD